MNKVFADKLLDGKVAFVAGGTRGFNLEIAKCYAQYGAKVAVLSRSQERVDAATESLKKITPHALGFAADVRDYDAIDAAIANTAETFGALDIVVAGQAGNFYAPAINMSANGFKAVIDIDLNGSFNVFRASFERLNRPGASLIAITAPEAVKPLHFQAHVCAAKAGLNQMLRCLALEWGPAGVRVNGISPGPIEGSWGMENVASPTQDIKDRITKALPLRRWGTHSDISGVALFLASEAASYMTGTIVEADGGAAIASPESDKADAVFDPSKDPRVKR